MSEATTIFDSMGQPIATGPPHGSRRGHWLAEVKTIRNPDLNAIKYWQQKSADLKHECETILEKAQGENRELSAGEAAWFDATLADVDWVKTEKIDPLLAERDRYLASLPPHGSTGGEALNGEGLRAKLARLQAKPGPVGRRYADLFPGSLDLGGFQSAREFFQVFSAGLSDQRLLSLMNPQAATMQENGVGAAGSSVVPSQLVAQWLDASLETEIVRPLCRIIPLTTLTTKFGGLDTQDLSTSSPGGFRATWSDENSEATIQAGKFRSVLFSACKLLIYAEASSELVEDGNDFSNQIGDAMIRSLGWGLDDSLLVSGTGAGQPLSVLNDPSLVTVAKESGQLGGTIQYENLIKMFSRLLPQSMGMGRAIFVASSTAIPALLSMTLGIGTSGAFLPAVRESDGKFTLLSLPLLFTEKLPVIGTKGDIMLIDFSQYVLALRKEVVLERSNTPGWSRDVQSFRVILRADGKGIQSQPAVPKNGDSRSWCVALASR